MSTTTPFNGTQTGTYVSSVKGNETFSRTITNQDGVRTSDTTFTLPDGHTVTREATLTQTATGWTRTATTTLANGKTVVLQETGTRQADGSIKITETSHGGAVQTDLTFSNPWGNTWTKDTQSSVSDGVKTTTTSGTTYSGASFSNSGALTILQSQST